MFITHNNKIITYNDKIISFTHSQPVLTSGSISFLGNSTSNLLINNDIDLRMGTGDFTIEWFQYQTDNNSFPRVFQMGNFPSATIGVSIEVGTFYFWANGTAISFGNVGTFKNNWVHFAVTRTGNTLRCFKNGNQQGNNINNTTNFSNTTNNLRIANETNTSAGASFGGLITNFHWVKGFSKYNTNFITPQTPISPITETKLLLLASNSNDFLLDSSGLNKNVNNSNTTWSSNNPFNL
jgi:hypothetical protein